jgi:FdhE protein
MKQSLDDRIARADELAGIYPAAGELLDFYRKLAEFQKRVSEDVAARGETDVRGLVVHFPAFINLLAKEVPQALADSRRAMHATAAQERLLIEQWEGPQNTEPAARFFGRVLLQPFAEYLASRGSIRVDGTPSNCPFCNARPLLAILRGEGDGGKRSLLCSLCSTEWPFRRVLCPCCGEENKDRLPIYVADDFDHVRVDACDTCRTYIKTVDLTKDGRAVPIVDEIATVVLDVWAEEHGYSKLEPNLLYM